MAGSFGDWFRVRPRAEKLRASGQREDLVRAVEGTPFSRHSDLLLGSLPALLSDDEVVVDLVEGRHGKQIGLLVLTTRRVLHVPRSRKLASVLVIDRADVVTAAGFVHRGMSVVTLTLTGGELVVDQILGNQAEGFVAHLLQPGSAHGSEALPARDPIDELIELRAMHRAGAVPEAEFQVRKKQLFDQI